MKKAKNRFLKKKKKRLSLKNDWNDSVGYLGDRVQRPMKESQENQQNAETQRERYYATIHKVALQQANTGGPDKIPGEPLLRYGRLPGLI